MHDNSLYHALNTDVAKAGISREAQTHEFLKIYFEGYIQVQSSGNLRFILALVFANSLFATYKTLVEYPPSCGKKESYPC